ncbi:MAG: TAXI family TRAP transporter solute-binding subunit [Granulosicoccus sp.]
MAIAFLAARFSKIDGRGGGLTVVCLIASIFSLAFAIEPRLIRIGTGGSSGTYFPIGTLIAESIGQSLNDTSDPSSTSRLIVLPQRSSGSVANVKDIGDGLLESGFAQANVAHWAYHGIGPFEQHGPITDIRALATLYFESLHLVAHVDSGIAGIADLVGNRVSVDEIGSGTELDVQAVLDSFDVSKNDLELVYLKPADSIDRLRQNNLDAFFIVAGYPISGVSELIEEGIATLVPIVGPEIDVLLTDHPFFTADEIPADAYSNSSAVRTLAVAAQWIISSDIEDDLVFDITKNLWSQNTHQTLVKNHQKGKELIESAALKGIGIPLHAGAYRYYEQAGLAVKDLPY